jgi:hypothetical protein
MTDIQKKLDRVISNVHKSLANEDFVIPQKTDQGILIGSILMVTNGVYKDLYRAKSMRKLYEGIHLNKCAIKMANLLALDRDQHRVAQIYQADQKFGAALKDYGMFKDKFIRAKKQNDEFKQDLYVARMLHSRDKYESAKFQAIRLTV